MVGNAENCRMVRLPVQPLPRAVIFDCDGTLVDSMPMHYEGWLAAFAAVGVTGALDEKEYLDLGGVPGPVVVEHVAAKIGRALDTEVILRRKRALVAERIGMVRPIEPVVSWLRWCHAEGLGLAVGSGGTRRIVLASLAATGLDAFFRSEHIFTADDVAAGKPAPDLFLAAAVALGVEPEHCLVVEDGPPGIAAAAAAGMRCLDVRPLLA